MASTSEAEGRVDAVSSTASSTASSVVSVVVSVVSLVVVSVVSVVSVAVLELLVYLSLSLPQAEIRVMLRAIIKAFKDLLTLK